MNELNGIRAGDIILFAYDDTPNPDKPILLNVDIEDYEGWHGGPDRIDSDIPLVFAMPSADLSLVDDAVNSLGPQSAYRNADLTPILVKIMEMTR